jgi:CRISPR-associated protein Csm4
MTPWQSDTIYGHLLWAALFLYGEEEMNRLIEEFKKNRAPFICSNGFYNEELPIIKKELILREDSKQIAKEIYGDTTPTSLIKTIQGIKECNKIKSINLKTFEKLRSGGKNYDLLKEHLKNRESLEKKIKFTEVAATHNIVNRVSGVVEEEGMYTLNEKFLNGDISIFVKLRENFPLKKLDEMLKYIELTGFGKKISSGKGQIERIELKEFPNFKEVQGANGFVVLSNYIPKEGDYTEVISGDIITKRGKIGKDFNSEFPFKRPFLCYIPGSVFKKGENKTLGKILEDIHVDRKIIQIGIPFSLEVKI